MNIIQTHHTTSGEQFLLSHIESIFAYATSNQQFAAQLAVMLKGWQTAPAQRVEGIVTSPHTFPTDQADAMLTAHWIMRVVQSHPEYRTTAKHLAHWVQNYESPKDVVLGIVGLAVIGPTLGIVNTKKKKKRKSQLVIEETYFLP